MGPLRSGIKACGVPAKILAISGAIWTCCLSLALVPPLQGGDGSGFFDHPSRQNLVIEGVAGPSSLRNTP